MKKRTASQKRVLRQFLADRDGECCQYCGTTEDLTLDHIDPSGPDAPSNLQLLCSTCNTSKGARPESVVNKSVRFASELDQRGFTTIPNVILLCPDVSPGAKVVYLGLKQYARQDEEAWPGQARLAEELGMTEKPLRGYLDELVKLKLIRRYRRGRGETNIYVIESLNGRKFRSRTGESPEEVDAVEEETEKPSPRGELALAALPEQELTAQTLTGWYVDEAGARGATVTKRSTGAIARNVKQLLDEGIPPEQVKLGIMRMLDRGIVQPSLLAQFVVEAGLAPKSRGRGTTTEEILGEAARLRREGK